MKTQLLISLATSLSAFAQGTIQLSNTDLPGPTPGSSYNAIINVGVHVLLPPDEWGGYPGDRGAGYWLASLVQEGSRTPLVTTSFFSGTGEDAQYNWMFATEPQVAVPGIAPGQTGQFFILVWRAVDGSPGNGATGQSQVFTSRPLGGPNPIPGELPFTTPVTTFQGFSVSLVPEPKTAMLFALSVAALLLRRRG